MQESELLKIIEEIDRLLHDPSISSKARSEEVRSLCTRIVDTRNNEFISRLFTWSARLSNSLYEINGDLYEKMICTNLINGAENPTHELHLIILNTKHFGFLLEPEEIIKLLPPKPNGDKLPIHIRRLFSFDEIRNLCTVENIHKHSKSLISVNDCNDLFGDRKIGGVFDPVIRGDDESLYSIFFIPILVTVGSSLFSSAQERISWTETANDRLADFGIFPKAPRIAREVLYQAICDAADTTIKDLLWKASEQNIKSPLVIVEYYGASNTEVSIRMRISIHNPETGNWIFRHSIPQVLPSDGARWRHNRKQLAERFNNIHLSAAPNVQPIELVSHSQDTLFLHVWFGPSVAFSDNKSPDGYISNSEGAFPHEHQKWVNYDLKNMKSISDLIINTLKDEIGPTDFKQISFEFLSCHNGRWYPSILIDFGIGNHEKAMFVRSKIQPLLEATIQISTFIDAREWSRWELLPSANSM